jgi:hypothetical protein
MANGRHTWQQWIYPLLLAQCLITTATVAQHSTQPQHRGPSSLKLHALLDPIMEKSVV